MSVGMVEVCLGDGGGVFRDGGGVCRDGGGVFRGWWCV